MNEIKYFQNRMLSNKIVFQINDGFDKKKKKCNTTL